MTALSLKTVGETDTRMTRRFAAPPEAVYRAHLDPQLIPRWMTGPEGWRMTSCRFAADGGFRHVWEGEGGAAFHMTGEILERDPGRRILHVERMHLPDPTPDSVVETFFEPADGGGTLMTVTMTLPDAMVRDLVIETGMAAGAEASYARIDPLLAAP